MAGQHGEGRQAIFRALDMPDVPAGSGTEDRSSGYVPGSVPGGGIGEPRVNT